MKMYDYTQEKRDSLGKASREHVLKNYGFERFAKQWADVMLDVHKKYGSWENRKNYNRWELKAV